MEVRKGGSIKLRSLEQQQTQVKGLSWCLEPSEPQEITSGLRMDNINAKKIEK